MRSILESDDANIRQVEKSFDEGWRILNKEVQNTLDNDTLCIAFRAKLNNKIANSAYKSFYEFIRKDGFRDLNDKNEDHIAFLEQWASVGHPVHPCYKNKPEMSPDEVLKYSPEFHPVVELKIVAVHNELIAALMPDMEITYQEWFAKVYPEANTQANEDLQSLGLNGREYSFIPVHPWQLDNVLPEWFNHLFETKKIVILDTAIIPSSSSVSFRSMMPFTTKTPNIKLPVTLQMTSVLR